MNLIPRRIIVIIMPGENAELYNLLKADLTRLFGQLLSGRES